MGFSAQLPEYLQKWGLWAGVIIATIGVLSLVVHYAQWLLPKVRLPTWLFRIFPDPVKRDVSLDEAFAYLGNKKWGASFKGEILGDTPAPEDTLNRLDIVRQAAVDKEITVWGKLQSRLPWVKIPADYWETWQIDYMSILKGSVTTEKSVNLSNYRDKYLELMGSKTEFQRKWP